MEPRSIERGNAARVFTSKSRPVLQWSHAQLSVETFTYPHGQHAYNQLQWSHAQLSVETCLWVALQVGDCRASMEPRSIERGNTHAIARAADLFALQWSHAQLSVETHSRAGSLIHRRDALQWSHAQLSVETRYARVDSRGQRSFNGATLN